MSWMYNGASPPTVSNALGPSFLQTDVYHNHQNVVNTSAPIILTNMNSNFCSTARDHSVLLHDAYTSVPGLSRNTSFLNEHPVRFFRHAVSTDMRMQPESNREVSSADPVTLYGHTENRLDFPLLHPTIPKRRRTSTTSSTILDCTVHPFICDVDSRPSDCSMLPIGACPDTSVCLSPPASSDCTTRPLSSIHFVPVSWPNGATPVSSVCLLNGIQQEHPQVTTCVSQLTSTPTSNLTARWLPVTAGPSENQPSSCGLMQAQHLFNHRKRQSCFARYSKPHRRAKLYPYSTFASLSTHPHHAQSSGSRATSKAEASQENEPVVGSGQFTEPQCYTDTVTVQSSSTPITYCTQNSQMVSGCAEFNLLQTPFCSSVHRLTSDNCDKCTTSAMGTVSDTSCGCSAEQRYAVASYTPQINSDVEFPHPSPWRPLTRIRDGSTTSIPTGTTATTDFSRTGTSVSVLSSVACTAQPDPSAALFEPQTEVLSENEHSTLSSHSTLLRQTNTDRGLPNLETVNDSQLSVLVDSSGTIVNDPACFGLTMNFTPTATSTQTGEAAVVAAAAVASAAAHAVAAAAQAVSAVVVQHRSASDNEVLQAAHCSAYRRASINRILSSTHFPLVEETRPVLRCDPSPPGPSLAPPTVIFNVSMGQCLTSAGLLHPSTCQPNTMVASENDSVIPVTAGPTSHVRYAATTHTGPGQPVLTVQEFGTSNSVSLLELQPSPRTGCWRRTSELNHTASQYGSHLSLPCDEENASDSSAPVAPNFHPPAPLMGANSSNPTNRLFPVASPLIGSSLTSARLFPAVDSHDLGGTVLAIPTNSPTGPYQVATLSQAAQTGFVTLPSELTAVLNVGAATTVSHPSQNATAFQLATDGTARVMMRMSQPWMPQRANPSYLGPNLPVPQQLTPIPVLPIQRSPPPISSSRSTALSTTRDVQTLFRFLRLINQRQDPYALPYYPSAMTATAGGSNASVVVSASASGTIGSRVAAAVTPPLTPHHPTAPQPPFVSPLVPPSYGRPSGLPFSRQTPTVTTEPSTLQPTSSAAVALAAVAMAAAAALQQQTSRQIPANVMSMLTAPRVVAPTPSIPVPILHAQLYYPTSISTVQPVSVAYVPPCHHSHYGAVPTTHRHVTAAYPYGTVASTYNPSTSVNTSSLGSPAYLAHLFPFLLAVPATSSSAHPADVHDLSATLIAQYASNHSSSVVNPLPPDPTSAATAAAAAVAAAAAAAAASVDTLYQLAVQLESTSNRVRGLTKDELDSLPVRFYGADLGLKVADTASVEVPLMATEERCMICLDDYEVKDSLRMLRCRHEFHAKCVDKWLKVNQTYLSTLSRRRFRWNPTEGGVLLDVLQY
ncbi:uncharacterized protein DEA37_0008028 [Paragonimus westermani]|uniref:RING-type domain-containing protein n=1 Tax=Paragonimus westermani TaxID=34504 RepID=A0A5J4NZ10_9TREM|nr:uncharacterized protein DEA37_0008028 [Paragonimus westermani]